MIDEKINEIAGAAKVAAEGESENGEKAMKTTSFQFSVSSVQPGTEEGVYKREDGFSRVMQDDCHYAYAARAKKRQSTLRPQYKTWGRSCSPQTRAGTGGLLYYGELKAVKNTENSREKSG